ncbi:MAG TPA: cytochrome c peroxidase [Planctomycetota bacterium]|nr:cytochrome c peroxidase [Planctomycetota bacterium]
MSLRSLLVAGLGLSLSVSSCGHSADAAAVPLGLKGQLMTAAPDNPLTEAKVALGKVLFFDQRLSGSGKMSCSTCHQHEKAWTDGERFAKKDDGSLNTRNTPTLYNVGYLDKLYWDGRSPTLEKTVRAAWEKQMSGKPDEVAGRLAAVKGYEPLFQAAFQGQPTADNIAMAVASFLRTLQSGDSPFDRWQAGDNTAVGNDVKEAFNDIFMKRGGCFNCHMIPLFTDKIFHNVGIGIDAPKPDIGVAAVNEKDEAKTGAFKTPTLRAAARSAPYFHDGSVNTLEEAVKFMGNGGKDNPHRDVLLKEPRSVNDDDIRKLVALIQSLASSEPFTPPVVPQ